jgi:hypothetical protein
LLSSMSPRTARAVFMLMLFVSFINALCMKKVSPGPNFYYCLSFLEGGCARCTIGVEARNLNF